MFGLVGWLFVLQATVGSFMVRLLMEEANLQK